LCPIGIEWGCGAAESADVNRSAELQLTRSHGVQQAAVCSARRQSLTEHVHAAAEDLSVWTVTAHHPAPLWRFSKRERITLRLLIAVAIPSVVCLSVHPTQPVEIFGIFHHTIAQGSTFLVPKIIVGGRPFPPEICV